MILIYYVLLPLRYLAVWPSRQPASSGSTVLPYIVPVGPKFGLVTTKFSPCSATKLAHLTQTQKYARYVCDYIAEVEMSLQHEFDC